MRRILAATLVAAFTATLAFAEDPKTKEAADEQAAMMAMMKAGTPGDAHKKLGPMVGTWDAAMKMWMKPGAPPTEASGVSTNTWALDGRWIEQRFAGTFMGMPFNGIGYTGYDNVKKEYIGTWIDNFGTQMMVSNGNLGADGKTYTFTSSMSDPMSGKTMPVQEKVTVVDDDHHVMEMWGPAPDGRMYKMMEITYTRKKS